MLNGLYDLQQAYNAFTYKEPVYLKGDLFGIYEIQLIRTDWVKGVEKRSWLVIAKHDPVVSIIYLTVILLLHRKLNRPLGELMQRHASFCERSAC